MITRKTILSVLLVGGLALQVGQIAYAVEYNAAGNPITSDVNLAWYNQTLSNSGAKLTFTVDKTNVTPGAPVVITWASSDPGQVCGIVESPGLSCIGDVCTNIGPPLRQISTFVSSSGGSVTKNPTISTAYVFSCYVPGVDRLNDVKKLQVNVSGVAVNTQNTTNVQNVAHSQNTAGNTSAIDTSSESCLSIPMKLSYRSRDSEANGFVTKLQEFLRATNYLSTPPTGFFGAGTFKAVKAFQKANRIAQTGSIGPKTQAKIKEISCALNDQEVSGAEITISDIGSSSTLPTGCTSATVFSPVTGVRCSQ